MKFMTPKEYGHILFQVFFKGRTLRYEIFREQEEKQNSITRIFLTRIFISFEVGIYTFISIEILLFILSFFLQKFDISFDFKNTLVSVALGVAGGVPAGVAFGVTMVVSWSVVLGVVAGIAGGFELGTGIIVAMGVALGIITSVLSGVALNVIAGISTGVIIGLIWGLFISILLGINMGIASGGAVIFFYFFVWLRWFYLPVYIISIYFKKMRIHKLPFHWDENICAPLPFLKFTLLKLARKNKQAVIEEAIFLIRRRPPQRKHAQAVLVQLAVDEMIQFRNIVNIANLKKELDFLPDKNVLPGYFNISFKLISRFARDVKKCLKDRNVTNRIRMIHRLREGIQGYQKQFDFAPAKQGLLFEKVIRHWIEIIDREILDLEARAGRPLPNPFKVGGPLEPDSEMFIGREDIIQHIQQEALREGGPGAILFIGNRRAGKTSTLKNLHRYFLSNLIPVYFDCHCAFDLNYFLNHIYKAIIEKQFPRAFPINSKISLGDFTDYLQGLETNLREKNQYLLFCFDEYERLNEKVFDGEFKDVPNALRYWIQHLSRIFCLFAGAHPIENLKQVDWTDYLINVRLVRISYLDQDSALKLVTEPIADFGLEYQTQELASNLVKRLGRQPFLLQATMSELVNYLNSINQKKATQTDIDLAIQKMLSSADVYFSHIWESDSNEQERQVLLAVTKERNLPDSSESAIKSLIKKEILFQNKDEYQFYVPVLKEWILQHV